MAKKEYTKGMVTVRPPGIKHGPLFSEYFKGCMGNGAAY